MERGRFEELLNARISEQNIETLWSLLNYREKRVILRRLFVKEEPVSAQDLKQALKHQFSR
ncbi:MAG: hypothetical protein ACWA5Q_08760 [bacterium]